MSLIFLFVIINKTARKVFSDQCFPYWVYWKSHPLICHICCKFFPIQPFKFVRTFNIISFLFSVTFATNYFYDFFNAGMFKKLFPIPRSLNNLPLFSSVFIIHLQLFCFLINLEGIRGYLRYIWVELGYLK